MVSTLTFLFCVIVLSATGAATVRFMLPNVPTYRDDREKLEALAWIFATGATFLLVAITMTGQA